LDRLLAMNQIALCRLISRQGSQPRFVALLPQDETIDEDGIQTSPPGFHVIALPYADDVRTLTLPPIAHKPTNDQIMKAKKLVKTLRIKFDSRNFENPSLQKHYASLQALALDREVVEEVPDYVQPDLEGMGKYNAIIEDFCNGVFPPGYDPTAKATKSKAVKQFKAANPKKRKNEANEGGDRPAKKEKKDEDAITEEQVRESIKEEKLKKFTLNQLKGFLRSQGYKGISKLKKKEDVMEKITELLDDPTESQEPVVVKKDSKEEKVKEQPIVHRNEEEEEEEEVVLKKSKITFHEKDEKDDDVEMQDKEEEEEEEEEEKEEEKKDSQPQSHNQQSQSQKYSNQSQSQSAPANNKPMCKYGATCYRKNAEHLKEFFHPKNHMLLNWHSLHLHCRCLADYLQDSKEVFDGHLSGLVFQQLLDANILALESIQYQDNL